MYLDSPFSLGLFRYMIVWVLPDTLLVFVEVELTETDDGRY